MKELQRKQRIRRIVYSIPSLIILSIIAFFLAKGALGVMGKKWVSSERSKSLEEQATALVNRERELREKARRLQTEEGIKDEIREKFNVTQEGELVAVIVDDQGVSSSTDNLALPWYRKFWNVIMSLYE
ncbi:MAG: hypothetical protein Q8Q22_01130 [bacterium]|nr:hypothetical protein [bacterium]MDZ4205991.1 hypothetical protein [Patescibacteria group bacterium]